MESPYKNRPLSNNTFGVVSRRRQQRRRGGGSGGGRGGRGGGGGGWVMRLDIQTPSLEDTNKSLGWYHPSKQVCRGLGIIAISLGNSTRENDETVLDGSLQLRRADFHTQDLAECRGDPV